MKTVIFTLVAVLLLLAACGGTSDRIGDTPALPGVGASDADMGAGADQGAAADAATQDASSNDLALGPINFHFQFDYRFDSHGLTRG